MLENILYVWAKINYSVSYRQGLFFLGVTADLSFICSGMNEIAGILLAACLMSGEYVQKNK